MFNIRILENNVAATPVRLWSKASYAYNNHINIPSHIKSLANICHIVFLFAQ